MRDYIIHRVWQNIMACTTKPNNKKCIFYQSRGIGVDPRWLDFDTFFADMGPKPTPKHRLTRLDDSKSFTPENCIWHYMKPIQRKKNIPKEKIEYNGQMLTSVEVSQITKIPYSTIRDRIKRGLKGPEVYQTERRPRVVTKKYCKQSKHK
jgi:hypothetical protein